MIYEEDDYYDDEGFFDHDDIPDAAWYCNHDVPDGCEPCAADRREQEMLDSMSDAERQEYLYGPGGSFDTYFAPGGPAWQAEQAEPF
jgi:hypothetical protein